MTGAQAVSTPVSALQRVIRSQRSESMASTLLHQSARQQLAALQTRIAELELIRQNQERLIAMYQRHLFGSRSEKIDPQELEARIAQAAKEAQEQIAQQKRPGDPPPEAEEEQKSNPKPARPTRPLKRQRQTARKPNARP